MTDERWQETIEKLSEQFSIVEQKTEATNDGHGSVERIVFTSPLGKLRLSRTIHDRVVGERAVGSNRIGGDVSISKVYSSEDQVDFLTVERENEAGDWTELDPSQLGIS
jgi:hypothetical protein